MFKSIARAIPSRPLLRRVPHTRSRSIADGGLLSGFLLPPVLFVGLGVTLWTQKCIMMILFQNKIIYMPSIPPLSKFETADDYAAECRPVRWTEDSLVTKDRVHISLLLGEMPDEATKTPPEEVEHVVVLYFQGLVVLALHSRTWPS